jgi:hypothetical protein
MEGMMLKEFVEKILSLGPVDHLTIHGREYADRPMGLIEPPRDHAPLELMTLTGLMDAVRAQLDGLDPSAWLIEVLSHQGVRIVSRHTGLYGRREVLLSVSLQDGEPFPFGLFLPREEFVIGLQSRFLQQGDVLEVLRLASGLEMSAVMVAEDDGISQRTTTRQGIALKETVTVKGRVKLRPYRTFREVEQPVSEFVFRLRAKEGMEPGVVVFEERARQDRRGAAPRALDPVDEAEEEVEGGGVAARRLRPHAPVDGHHVRLGHLSELRRSTRALRLPLFAGGEGALDFSLERFRGLLVRARPGGLGSVEADPPDPGLSVPFINARHVRISSNQVSTFRGFHRRSCFCLPPPTQAGAMFASALSCMSRSRVRRLTFRRWATCAMLSQRWRVAGSARATATAAVTG